MSDETGPKKTSPGLQPAPRSTFHDSGAPATEPTRSDAPPKSAFGPKAGAGAQATGKASEADGKKKCAKTMVVTPGTVPPPAPARK
ncbi:MAG: hypothetical protein OXT09_29505, partial [Myxococcales bacterium]|nr:hypothetical protein [Myxococcales bacterium]